MILPKKLFWIFAWLAMWAMPSARAQVVSFKDSVLEYDRQRIVKNFKGARVLGCMGITSMVAGGTGLAVAKSPEWRYFHGTNVAWGAINTGIAAWGIARAHKQAAEKHSISLAYHRYRADKRALLINSALDMAYISTGLIMANYGVTAKTNAPLLTGAGRSIATQGMMLLLFDYFLFAAHQRSNSKWVMLMDEIRVTNTSIGWQHTF